MTSIPYFTAAEQVAAASIGELADALAASIHQWGLPRGDPARTVIDMAGGQLMLMPSTTAHHLGVKVLTVAHDTIAQGTPRVQGLHVQFDMDTFAPIATLDAAALTNLRTAAVSVLALRHLASPSSHELLVFGAGPQAVGHIRGIAAEWPLQRVRVTTLYPTDAHELIKGLAGELPNIEFTAVPLGSHDHAVASADIIVCATTSKKPVFESGPSDGSSVVAIGSHSPQYRELPGSLLRRAFIAVEDRETALREAGDLLLAIQDGDLSDSGIHADLPELVSGAVIPNAGPRVFKSVGMAWEDVVTADTIVRYQARHQP
jgi:ornithine cyclodeaminase/alanine dehydrogenase-like protein (mu-crystallin family)